MSRSVLIVEDEVLLARTLANALRDAGFEVVTAESGEIAEAHLLPAHQFDVVLLDHRLPGEPGLTVLERMRAAGQETPVLMMTAYETASMRSRAIELKAAGFFRKPFNLGELLDSIEQLAAGGGAARMGAHKGTDD